MKNVLKKIIVLSRIGLIKRYFKYKKYTKFLNIKNGFITDVNQLELRGSDLYSTGDDPFVSIKLFKLTNKIRIKYNIKTANNDEMELYYIPKVVKNAGFCNEWMRKVGLCDGKLHTNDIVIYDNVKNIRIDFGKNEGLIHIKDFSLLALNGKVSSENLTDLLLSTIPNSKNDKKIIVVTHSMNETGAPILAYNIAKKYHDKKYEVVVISLADGYLEEKFVELSIPVINLHQSGINDKILKIKELENIVKTLKEKGYTNVITNTIISGLVVPLFHKYDFNIVSLIHEMKKSIVEYNMENGGRNINMYSNTIVFPDKIVEEEFYSIFNRDDNKSVIATQGLYKNKENIQLDRQKVLEKYNLPTNAKIIVGSGTADFRKGIDLFLNAAQQLTYLEKDEEYHFIWAGKIMDPNMEKWFNCQLERDNIQERFHNIDFIKDKKEYQNLISCSDAFWLTSREDPYPSVMIESLEYGTPVLAFKNCGGANTLLDDNRGILIANFDTKKLAEETHNLLKDPKKVDFQITNAQKYIKKHLNFDKYIEILEKLFDVENKKIKFEDVSVIVPNYNYEEYLPIRLKSIINQTIKPREIIVLDDVSTDNSIEVCESILIEAKKQYGIDYKIVVNEKNNGCFKQWIKGIELAKYEYIWIAEADDYAKNNFIEILLPAFKDKNVVLSYCQSKVINEHCDVIDYRYTSYTDDLDINKWHSDFIDDGKKQIVKYFSKKNIIPNASSTIIRKSATEGLSEILSKYSIIGDWVAYIYIISKGKISYSSKCLNGHRRHSNSIIARKEKSVSFIKEILFIKEYIVDNFEMNDKEINQMLLSIEGFDFYSKMISENEELSTIYSRLLEKVKVKKKKENIMIIIPDLSVGGGQSVAIRLANSMVKKYNVFLVNARDYIKTDIMENMISNEVTVLKNNSVESLNIYNDLLNFKSVISFVWWSDKLAYQAFENTNVKLIISMHGCYEMLLHNPDVDKFFNENYDKILERADKIVYTAEKNKEALITTKLSNSKKVSKIDNGFILGEYPKKNRELLNIKKDDFVFGLVARAIPEKGYEEAIKAINLVNKNSKKKAHLVLVGASEYIDRLKLKYNEEYIHFIDKFTLPSEWIGWEEIFDVGILPSYFKSESLPTVIIENLFLGNPIIATDIAEIKSMIVNDEKSAGIVINLENGKASVKELAQAMKKVMNDKKIYDEFKKNTKFFTERFNMDNCVENYSKLIEDDNNE